MIDLIKVLISLTILAKAGMDDLRVREVSDKLWIIMALSSIPLNSVQYISNGFDLFYSIVQFAIVFSISSVMYFLLGFGGADFKALVCLAIMFPKYPEISVFPVIRGFNMFAFSVLLNSLLIEFCTVTPIVLLKNIVAGRICVYSFIGYKVPVNRIPRFHNLLEYVDESGKIIRSVRGVEPNEDILNRLMRAREMGIIRDVWVTPALPFLFFMLIGFLSAMTIGDIAYLIVYEIFKSL